jgi:hypothetical protein
MADICYPYSRRDWSITNNNEDRMTRPGQRISSGGHHVQQLTALFAVFVLLAGCQARETIDSPRSVEEMMNGGQQEHSVGVNEPIVINANSAAPQWEVSLGRFDAEHAVFAYFDNRVQSTVRFTQAGKYQVNLGSHRAGGQKATMMHALTVVVQ